MCTKLEWITIVLFFLFIIIPVHHAKDLEKWFEWTTGYCHYPKGEQSEKVTLLQCNLREFIQQNDVTHLTTSLLNVCHHDDDVKWIKSELIDDSCKSNQCIIILTLGYILGFLLVLVTIGVALHFYRKKLSPQRKLLSETIYDEAVYDDITDKKPNSENFELIENDLYEVEIPSPRTPGGESKSHHRFNNVDDEINIYESVP